MGYHSARVIPDIISVKMAVERISTTSNKSNKKHTIGIPH